MAVFNKSQLFKRPGEGGGSGKSEHDLGFYSTAAALRAAHPTAVAGDFALVGETDTFWVWDVEGSEWVDSHKAESVESVNGQTGVVVLGGSDINATIGGETDTVTGHLTTIKNDLDDLGEEVTGKTSKSVITLTGESGTLTAAQITAITNDNNVIEIVCDGQIFRLSDKSSSLTYRTYTSTDSSSSDGLKIQAIYVQLNSGAANYGAWSKEELPMGDSLPDQTGHSGEFLTTDGTDASWAAVNAMEIIDWEA